VGLQWVKCSEIQNPKEARTLDTPTELCAPNKRLLEALHRKKRFDKLLTKISNFLQIKTYPSHR